MLAALENRVVTLERELDVVKSKLRNEEKWKNVIEKMVLEYFGRNVQEEVIQLPDSYSSNTGNDEGEGLARSNKRPQSDKDRDDTSRPIIRPSKLLLPLQLNPPISGFDEVEKAGENGKTLVVDYHHSSLTPSQLQPNIDFIDGDPSRLTSKDTTRVNQVTYSSISLKSKESSAVSVLPPKDMFKIPDTEKTFKGDGLDIFRGPAFGTSINGLNAPAPAPAQTPNLTKNWNAASRSSLGWMMRMVPRDESWGTPALRQSMTAKLEENIMNYGLQSSKNAVEMEGHVFVKSKSKDEYLSFVARLIVHMREMGAKKDGPGMSNPQNPEQGPANYGTSANCLNAPAPAQNPNLTNNWNAANASNNPSSFVNDSKITNPHNQNPSSTFRSFVPITTPVSDSNFNFPQQTHWNSSAALKLITFGDINSQNESFEPRIKRTTLSECESGTGRSMQDKNTTDANQSSPSYFRFGFDLDSSTPALSLTNSSSSNFPPMQETSCSMWNPNSNSIPRNAAKTPPRPFFQISRNNRDYNSGVLLSIRKKRRQKFQTATKRLFERHNVWDDGLSQKSANVPAIANNAISTSTSTVQSTAAESSQSQCSEFGSVNSKKPLTGRQRRQRERAIKHREKLKRLQEQLKEKEKQCETNSSEQQEQKTEENSQKLDKQKQPDETDDCDESSVVYVESVAVTSNSST